MYGGVRGALWLVSSQGRQYYSYNFHNNADIIRLGKGSLPLCKLTKKTYEKKRLCS